MSDVSREHGATLHFEDTYDRLAAHELAIAVIEAQRGGEICALPTRDFTEPGALDTPAPHAINLRAMEDRVHAFRYGRVGSVLRILPDEAATLSTLVRQSFPLPKARDARHQRPRIEAILAQVLEADTEQPEHADRSAIMST